MPPKRSSKGKGQNTLTSFMTNEVQQMTKTMIEERLQKQTKKLLKIRQQIAQRRREEQKIINNILKLQISHSSRFQEVPSDQDEQYWIMTKESALPLDYSIVKIILGDYGEVIVGKVKSNDQKNQKEQKTLDEQAEQWKQKGNLNSSYLQEYTPDFITTLKEYQYLAEQFTNPKDI